MNLYMRALGFSRMDSKAEAEFIQEGIKECIDEGLVLKNPSALIYKFIYYF